MGLCGVGESHAPDAFAAVLNQTTDTHLSATRINNDGIMQGTALPSTPPVWVATADAMLLVWDYRVSIHATRVGGDYSGTAGFAWELQVSIHATRVGGDRLPRTKRRLVSCFYPRHPCGWRPFDILAFILQEIVSIHATRVGGDSCTCNCPVI